MERILQSDFIDYLPLSTLYWTCTIYGCEGQKENVVTAGDLLLPSNVLSGIHQNCCYWEENYREMRWRCGEYWPEAQAVPDSLQPYGLQSPWNSPGQNTGVGSHSILQGNLPNPGIKPRSPTLQADSLPAESPGKPPPPRPPALIGSP